MSADQPNAVRVRLETSEGDITLELDTVNAPKSSENFRQYVASGHYDGLTFHRVIRGFMIQGGGYDEQSRQRKTRAPVENEARNGLKNARGTVAMARTNDPHSATSQFFINHVDNSSLDHPSFDGWGYAVFGKVIDGMHVVDRIAETPTGNLPPFGRDVPKTPIVIRKAVLI